MANGDQIVVTEEAREMMNDLADGASNHLPSEHQVTMVVGAELSEAAQSYRREMIGFASRAYLQFTGMLEDIQVDCGNAVKAIDDLTAQDEEIMMMLNRYAEEVDSAASDSRDSVMKIDDPSGITTWWAP